MGQNLMVVTTNEDIVIALDALTTGLSHLGVQIEAQGKKIDELLDEVLNKPKDGESPLAKVLTQLVKAVEANTAEVRTMQRKLDGLPATLARAVVDGEA